MRRLAAIAASAALVVATSAVAADKPRRIGWVTFTSIGTVQPSADAFREALRGLGYVEGKTIAIEHRSAEGRDDRLPAIAAELVAMAPEVIVTAGSRVVRALKDRTDTIPIVVAVMSDPVGAGFIKSYARPGDNITGLAFQDAELVTKRVELLKELVPGLARVAMLYDPVAPAGGPGTVLDAATRAVNALGLDLQLLEIRAVADLGPALATARAQGAQGVLQVASPFFSAHRQALVDAASRAALPLVCEQAGFVAIGCLASYGPDFVDMYRRAADYVDKILRGAKPGDLPVQQPAKFELFVNLTTARALRLELPANVLARADEVIE